MVYNISKAKTWACFKHKKYSPKCEDCRRAMYQQIINEGKKFKIA